MFPKEPQFALLQQVISEQTFYKDLVYKFKMMVGQFKKIIKRYKRGGYNMSIMGQPGYKPSRGL